MGLYSASLDTEYRDPREARTTFHHDQSDDRIIVEVNQKVDGVLKQNAEMRNSSDGFDKARDVLHAAQIPTAVYQKMIKKHGLDPTCPGFQAELLILLDSDEYSYLKTTEYKVASRGKRKYFHSAQTELRPVYKADKSDGIIKP